MTYTGVLIVRGGELVLEEYFGGYRRDAKHMIASCTKSFVSALIGIALDQGRLEGVDSRMFRFFPEYERLMSPGEKDITVSDLLTMTAGFDWDETSTDFKTDPDNILYQMVHSENWTEFVLSRLMLWVPGERFNYCSGCSVLLGSILYKATGLPADLFAEIHLFGPLGVTDYRWDPQPDGLPQTEGGLHLRPRDMAKFGLLILNGGVWGGRRIISERWVHDSTARHVDVSDSIGYGYHWWRQAFTVDDQVIEIGEGQWLERTIHLHLPVPGHGGGLHHVQRQPPGDEHAEPVPAALGIGNRAAIAAAVTSSPGRPLAMERGRDNSASAVCSRSSGGAVRSSPDIQAIGACSPPAGGPE